MVLAMTEVELDIHTKQDGIGARKPDLAVSRSEKSALVSNQAEEHALRTALRNINHMQHVAATQHDHQVQQFIDSISDGVFVDHVTTDGAARRRLLHRRNSRSLDDVTLDAESQGRRFLFRRPESLDFSASSSQEELPDIHKRSSTGTTPKALLSPRETDPTSPRRQAAHVMVKRLSNISSNEPASCPNSPITRRKMKVEKLDVNQSPVLSNSRPRASSFNSSPTSAGVTSPNSSNGFSYVDGQIRTSSFTGSSSGTSAAGALPSPRRLRAQVKKNIQSDLEAARQQALRKKRILAGKDCNESWENQLARDQIERSDRLSSDSEEEPVTSPYSISSSMRISRTAGTFEKQTGKQGLKAWMGRQKPKGTKK